MPFENVSCQGRIENFFSGGAPNFVTFFKRSFFRPELIISNLSNERTLGGCGGMLLQKNFENLHAVMAIAY